VLVATVVGNRPQFVKAAAVSRKLREVSDEVLVHTGQHYDDELSRIFFDELGIPAPDRQLDIHDGTNTDQTAQMLAALGPLFGEIGPDLVLVYGDTNSTLAGALAAAQLRIPVAHVEAGMRSFDRAMPEELNRVLADHTSDLLFCSTQTAVDNLANEGITRGVHLAGDVMADVALTFLPLAEARSTALQANEVTPGDYLLMTVHRAGNVDVPERLERVVELAERLPLPAVFPVHPRTRARLRAAGLEQRLESAVKVTQPLGYLDFLKLAAHARRVLTDSGGVQKEAYLVGTPCVTLRDTTEWVETVEHGWNVLVDLNVDDALHALARPDPHGERPELYGGGHAADRIRAVLATYTGS
jgi:UDP-N-acetylglucosamine 2-epimerase (non-hydrolysing)/UDP-GlcNAc3NAcA epimerase